MDWHGQLSQARRTRNEKLNNYI